MLDRAHPRILSVVVRLAVLAAGLAVTAGVAAAQGAAYDWTADLRPGETLRVYSANGEVTVARAAGSTARVRGRGEPDSRGRFNLSFEARRVEDGGLVCVLYEEGSTCSERGIDSRGGRGSQHGRVHLEVELPEGVELRVATGNGDVEVAGATADVRASSGNGRVRVGPGAARVEVASGNGDVTVEEARSAVEASSGNGSIRISTAAGPVSASTGNGRIEARMASLPADGDMRFSSGNGSITLLLPDDFSARLSARTGRGGFEFDFPVQVEGRMSANRVTGSIGDARRRLEISTGNGSIELRRGR